jgi:hypothetical protein
MSKCNKCLRTAKSSITGINKKTLKIDMGGAVIYITPGVDGNINVSLNAESLVDGNYLYCIYDGNSWII